MKKIIMVIVVAAALGVCVGAEEKEDVREYRMPTAEFVAKFSVMPNTVPRAPKSTFAPLPAFPYEMMRRNLNGWSTYAIRIDAKGKVKTADLVAYSRKEFGNARDSLILWRFSSVKKEGLYLIRLLYNITPEGLMVDQVI